MRDSEDGMAARVRFPLPELSVAVWMPVIAGLVILGSDLLWVVAMGDVIRDTGSVPHRLPFASAPQAEWHNPLAVAQLFLSVVHSAGTVALAAVHLVVVAVTLAVVVAESRRLGGGDVRTTLVVALVVVGCATPFVVSRLPDLSLVPFVVAVVLMRRQHERPTRAVWWLVPLFALWGNLHGGVLVGTAVLGVFLLASRGGGAVGQRLLLGAAAVASLLVTSAGLGTPAYYVGVLTNEAAARGTDLWSRPDPSNPLDLAMLGAAVLLLAMCVRRGLPPWEWLVVAGLVVGTVSAARNGVWLLLFLAPAAAGRRHGPARLEEAPTSSGGARPRWWWPVVAIAAGVSVLLCAWQLGRRADEVGPPGASVVAAARAVADGRPVLADEPVAETLAQAGLTVWAANPIDAFPRPVQAEFLDFLHDGRVPSSAADVEVAVVQDSLADDVLAGGGWVEVARADGYLVLTRRP